MNADKKNGDKHYLTLENCVTKATTTKRRKKGTNASKEGFEHLVFDEKEDISLLRYSVQLCILLCPIPYHNLPYTPKISR
jgi:hypothetical protein